MGGTVPFAAMDFELPGDGDPRRVEIRDWLAANPSPTGPQLAAAGYVAPHWPAPWGLDADPIHQIIVDEELRRARVRRPNNPIGIGWAGPTILAAGTDDQKDRYLSGILSGEDIWCQLFSEPEAGSDLAALATRAERDGDEWVVNGQKIWTSLGHLSRYGILIARTNPDAPKHKGISWVVCDMTTPGIEIREIQTMSHVTDFCEVFYDDVRIPLTNVVGGLNNGWRTAMSTLSFERGTAFMADQVELASTVERLIGEARSRTDAKGRALIADEEIARRLATARAEVDALKAMTITGISRTARTGVPGAEGSMVRYFHGELHQRVYQLSLDIIGGDALRLTPVDGDVWTGPYLQSFAYTIGGGTTDIQRNIVGERVLGLPRA